jgi:hypothetical protein
MHPLLTPLLTPLLISIAIGAFPAAAQTPSPTAGKPSPTAVRAQPEDPQAAVPPVVHRSALRPATRPEATPVGSWTEANRVVDQVGGWKAYLKEAHGTQPPAAPSRPPEKRP